MKLYCPKCYNKIDYKFTKPKFCSKCGASVSDVPETKVDASEKSDDKLKIEMLEKKIKELSASRVQKPVKNNQQTFSAKNVQDQDESDDNDAEDNYDDSEDYDEIQGHIENFKRRKNKSGITVEYAPSNNSISFGTLMESAASGKTTNSEEFKMIEDGSQAKSPDKILEELKIESAGEARIIEIN